MVIVFSAALLSYVMVGVQTAEIVEMVDLETVRMLVSNKHMGFQSPEIFT